MTVTELDTFVKKFYQLWNAGHVAHLDVDSYAGKAWVGLCVQLAQAPGPLHPHQHQNPKKSDSHSRQRCCARRAATRADVVDAENAANPQEAEADGQEPDKVSNLEVEVAEEVTPDKNVIVPAVTAEKAMSAGFECCICEKNYKTERGLNSHFGQSHRCIPQMDGTSEELDISFSFESEYATEDVMYTIEEVLTDEIKVEINSRVKVGNARSSEYLFSIRVSPPSIDWQWPDMNQIQREVLKNLRKDSSICC